MASGEGKNVSFPFVKNYMGLSVDDESMKSLPHAKVDILKTKNFPASVIFVLYAFMYLYRR